MKKKMKARCLASCLAAVSHTSFETVDGFQKGESIGTEQNGIKGKSKLSHERKP